jgi:transcription elongation factor Elf1
MSEEIDHEYTPEAVCPYCGHVRRNSCELADEGEIECGECGKDFAFFRVVTVDYCTRKVEDKP